MRHVHTARYRRLALEIARDQIESECAEIEPQIEAYVDAEQSGEEAHQLYRAVWSHLQGCAHCRAVYEALTQAGTEE